MCQAGTGGFLPVKAVSMILTLHRQSLLPLTQGWARPPNHHYCRPTTFPTFSLLFSHYTSQHPYQTLYCLHYSASYSGPHFITLYFPKMHMLRLVVSGLGLVTCSTARNIINLQPDHQGARILPLTHGNSSARELVGRGVSNRCGPEFGKCAPGKCCSTAGVFGAFRPDSNQIC